MNWQDTFVRLVKAALPKAEVTFRPGDDYEEDRAKVRLGEHWVCRRIGDKSLEKLEDAAWAAVESLVFALVNDERCKIAAEERRRLASTNPVATGTCEQIHKGGERK